MSSDPLRARTAVTYLADILPILQSVDLAATLLCNELDKACEHAERQVEALKDLRKGVKNLKSDIMLHKLLMTAMQQDAGLRVKGLRSSSHPHTDNNSQNHKLEGLEGIWALKRAFKATQLALDDEENPANIRHGATMKPSGKERPKTALKSVLNVLRTNFCLGGLHGLISDLKDATDEVFVCQQNNERVFKPLWYRYVATKQWCDCIPVVYIDGIQDRVWTALGAVLETFRAHPFAVSPEKIRHKFLRYHIFAILNHNHVAATRHQTLARRIGKAWVDDHVRGYFNVSQVQELGALQTSLFELLWGGAVEQLKGDSPHSFDDPERPEFERTLGELERGLKKAIVRLREQRFTIVFCGTVEADKSLFLNALMGRAILPSDESPSTAWPCRFRHVDGQIFPLLQFQAEPFLVALKKFQDRQYGQKMQAYQPPPENMSEAPPLSDPLSDPSNEEILLRTIHSQWAKLHAVTRDNLLKFETPGFKLPRGAQGNMNVKILLDQLNDIVRLCQQFDLGFDMSEGNWPLLTVEFNSLRGHQMDGIYEFIDLPVIGEGFRDANFESLARLVASDSNAIVPIVSFKDIHRSDWKRLPELIARGFNRTADVVVCTHLDPVSQENMDGQLKPVKEAFWPRGVLSTNRVIPCSLKGISARYLLYRSNTTKPLFKAIWNKRSMGYRCAAKVLGVEDPRATYGQLDIQMWRDKLQEELPASSLSGDIQSLAKKMVDSVRATPLFSEADTVIRQFQGMRIVYEQKLLIEATRIEAEYVAAKRRCNKAVEISQAVLETLGRVGSIQSQEVRLLLEKKLGVISQRACGLINQTITKTLTDSGMSLEDMDAGHGTQNASIGKRGVIQFGDVQLGNGDINDKLQESSSAEAQHDNFLVTETRAQAKDFLRLCQRELSSALETLKEEYTTIILDLAGTENAKLLKVVRGMIKQAELQPLPEDWENRIGDLGRPSLSIDGLAFQEISGVINSHQLSLFNRQYCIEIDTLHDRLKGDIIDPWIRKLKEEGEATLLGTTGTSLMAATDWLTSALLIRTDRCNQELDYKNRLVGETRVERLTAMYSNLLAAEEALKELFARVEAL